MSGVQKEKIIIRPMQVEDLDEVVWVEQSCFSNPWTRKLFEEEFKHPELSHYFTAGCEHHIVGYMGFWLVHQEAHITNLAVHPAFQRQGIGARLLHTTMQAAQALGAERATLEVRASNIAAHQLYEKHGFKMVAIRRHYYEDNHEDAWIMWRDDLSEFAGISSQNETTGRTGG